jgi:hypothetical protein
MDRDGIFMKKRVSYTLEDGFNVAVPTYNLRREGDIASAKRVQANNQHREDCVEKNGNNDLAVNCAFDET